MHSHCRKPYIYSVAVERHAVFQFVMTEANSRMFLSWAWFLTLLLSFVGQHVTFALQDVTGDLFGSENYGTVAAFGDFNSDKQTDIFIIRKRKYSSASCRD